jgi:hypothetical protein
MSGSSIPGREAQVMWPQPLGPRVPCVQSCPDRICPVLLTPHSLLSIGGGWRAKQSWCTHRSLPQSGGSTKHWPLSTATFFTRPRSVSKRKMKKIFPVCPTASSFLTCFFVCCYYSFYLMAAQMLPSCRQRWPGRERSSSLQRPLTLW